MVLALALGGVSAVFNACAAAENPPLQTPEQLALQVPSCRTVDGRPVTFIPVSKSAESGEDATLRRFLRYSLESTGAFATMNPPDLTGTPVIVYNTDILGHVPEFFSRFVFQHECFHHALGHVKEKFSRPYSFRPSDAVVEAAEEEADCHAIRELIRKKRYGRREMDSLPKNFRHLLLVAWLEFPADLRYYAARVNENVLKKRFTAQKACYNSIPASP